MSEQRYAVVDPSDGKEVRAYPTSTDAEVEAAVAKADAAYQGWGRDTSVSDRAKCTQRAAELHTERREELASIISREMGKPREQALMEVDVCAGIFSYYAANAEDFLADEELEVRHGVGTALIRRQPLGVLLGIMPWNFPAYQVARFAAPNLVAGNTIVLKHAPQCPESAAALADLFRDAGFPEGTYNNIYATNAQIENVIADRRVQGVSLTGSERAGAAVAEIAGRHLKKVVLELGGSDPFIVLSTDDIDATVKAAVVARVGNNGQACNAGKRMIVHEDLYEEFVTRFTAQMTSIPASPLSSEAAAARLEEQVSTAVAGGAELAGAAGRTGAWFSPGVLTAVENCEVATDELFGPVAMVFKVRDEDEAVELANSTDFGLGSYVFTTDPEQARRVADRLDAGMVFINGVNAAAPELPFGGVKRSGFGRELGRLGIEEFINRKMIRTVR